ncbi:hypothetical protein SKAU_G00320720 [Synaphobranchus kaupii]|uniref:Uncharacterized protein n=1 Tax=Synaphobranchus kaupii TaxID=118154 RepID=A0A9Q1ENQ5_SYNKA|nr:hypothetical protein SKAU_G00320720 [Synaphobranchus kaupii]
MKHPVACYQILTSPTATSSSGRRVIGCRLARGGRAVPVAFRTSVGRPAVFLNSTRAELCPPLLWLHSENKAAPVAVSFGRRALCQTGRGQEMLIHHKYHLPPRYRERKRAACIAHRLARDRGGLSRLRP